MNPVARRIDAYWLAPAPARRLAMVRILVGTYALVYLLIRVGHVLSYAHLNKAGFRPVGVVGLVLDRPLVPWLVQFLAIATVAAAVPFVLGWRYRVFGPAFAVLLLWTLSYRHSWGMVWHTENLLVVQALIVGIVPAAADAWSLDARRAGGDAAADHPRYGWPLKLMCVVIVIAYMLAGYAKLRNAGTAWLWGDELRNHIAIDNARKLLLGDWYSPLAGPLLHYNWLFRVLALLTVVFELGAPVALLGRRFALVWVLMIWSFHAGVLALMMIAFPYQLSGVAFACFFCCERLGEWVHARVRARLKRTADAEGG